MKRYRQKKVGKQRDLSKSLLFLCPEDGDSKFLRNVDAQLVQYTASDAVCSYHQNLETHNGRSR
jgi:hypothetical protein